MIGSTTGSVCVVCIYAAAGNGHKLVAGDIKGSLFVSDTASSTRVCGTTSSIDFSCSSSSLALRNHWKLYWLANSSITARGSNTETIIIITQVTAFSRILASGLLPYTKAAMYLMGPTSASTLRISAAIGARSSLSMAMAFCDLVMSELIWARSLA